MRNRDSSLKSRRSIRLPGYDYRQSGVYFVTLCTYQKAKLFGTVVDGELKLNDLGEVVSEEWQLIPRHRRNVLIDQFVVMPNHFHGLVITDSCYTNESRGHNSLQDVKPPRTLSAGSLGAIVGQFKLAVSRQAKYRRLHPYKSIWQRNYYDHIVRNEASLKDIRRYIVENPARWRDDRLYVD